MSDFTMLNSNKIRSFKDAANKVLDVDGDFVDCGVFRGGSTMLMIEVLLAKNQLHRKVYLFDTFEGMPQLGKFDRKIRGENIGWRKNWCYCPLDTVKENVSSLGYPEENIIYVKGKIEDTVHSNLPDKIALLHLDMDFYSPTKVALNTLYPILNSGGKLIIDDYGCWYGCKKAVNEYFNKPEFDSKTHSQRIITKK